MKVISINNQKGGVGKTTTALALASILTKKSKKVLLVDCDGSSQTLTKILTRKEATNNTLTDLILLQTMGRDISPFAKQTIFNCDEGYDLLTADNKLVAASASLSMQHNLDIRFGTLKHILSNFEDYDYVILDAAPVLDILAINQLVASDELIIVSQCQKASKEAVNELLQTVDELVRPINPSLDVKGILITMQDKRTKYGSQKIEEMKSSFNINIFDTIIPRSVSAEKYVDKGESLILAEPNSLPAKAYEKFVEEYCNMQE